MEDVSRRINPTALVRNLPWSPLTSQVRSHNIDRDLIWKRCIAEIIVFGVSQPKAAVL